MMRSRREHVVRLNRDRTGKEPMARDEIGQQRVEQCAKSSNDHGIVERYGEFGVR